MECKAMHAKKIFETAVFVGFLLVGTNVAFGQSTPCPGTGDAQEADCLYEQGVRVLEKDHDLPKGQSFLMAALAVREKLAAPTDPIALAANYLALADIYHALGRNGKAEPMYRHSLNVLRESVGYDHIDNVKVIDHLAIMLMDMGRTVEAEPGLQHSVRILEREKGPESPDLIAPLDKLAWICDSQHREMEAAAYRKRIAAIKAKAN